MKEAPLRDRLGEALVRENNLLAENAKLRALLKSLRWESIDKDNMEFQCTTTCYVIDEIRATLNEETK